ncbi:MAG: lipoyl(octanoyl) transferase LipB [candidate division KSB1 bacterium]|nr:lipoyl(octanoyl) transferase LipB [candidate division KSB1 bacterium]
MISKSEHIILNREGIAAFRPAMTISEIGIISLEAAERLMQRLAQQRLADQIPDTILLLSHPPSLAVGARELNPADLLLPLSYFEGQGIYLHQHVRGGGLTYHWPGQLVCYPILKLQPHEQNIGKYMYKLEEVGLRTLKDLGIVAERKRDKAAQIGLWLGNNKIASMGIHVSRWITSWGFALNLYGDKSPADFIRPCGLEGVKLITAEEILGFAPSKQWVTNRLVSHFAEVFEREIEIPKNKFQITNKFQIQGFNSKI